MTVWYIDNGPESDVVISSRVRLARNLKDFPFPFMMDSEKGGQVIAKVKDALFSRSDAMTENFEFVDLKELSPAARQMMVERHLISPDLAAKNGANGVVLSKDEKISIMVNEEDHLRIQCMFAGMQIWDALLQCDKIDNLMEETLDFAFNKEYGYLTCCPTNIGTGIRASAMLHLPALTMTGYVRGVLEACSKLGAAVRGMYGENSEAAGSMYQISNQVSLGQSENEIIAGITNIVSQIVEQERNMRKELYRQNPHRIEDKIYRSYGLFANARIMTAEESLKLISDVRLGVDMGIIKDMNIEVLNELMVLTQPANLQNAVGKPLSPDERDVKRADVIRERLCRK